jgi:serine/threonine-protein kinase
MSPEQFAGDVTDARSDQWSFCAALYQALYGQMPFAGEDVTELSDNVHHGRLRPAPSNRQVPVLIAETLRRGMEVAPEDRFPSMAELLAALDMDPQHDPAAAPQLGQVFSLAMLVTGGLLSAIIASSLERGSPSMRQLFISALVLLGGSLLAAWYLRAKLNRNHFHRGLVKMVIILTAQMTLLRAVALVLGLSLAQAGAMEMVATSGLLATSSVHYLPALWPMTIACALLAVLIPLSPTAAWAIVGVFYPVLGLVFLYALDKAARQVGPRGSLSRLRQRQVRRQYQGSYSGQEPSSPSQPQSQPQSQDSGPL